VRDNETPELLKGFVTSQGLKHTILVGGSKVGLQYRVEATPTTFAINSEGAIVDSWLGLDPARLEAAAAKVAVK